jgi:transposase-like protein
MEGEHTIPTPACPSCGNSMRLVRAIPASGLPELRTYDCRQCGVAMTEADDSQLASTAASDRAPVIRVLLNHGLMVSVPDPQPDPKMDQRDTALKRRRL